LDHAQFRQWRLKGNDSGTEERGAARLPDLRDLVTPFVILTLRVMQQSFSAQVGSAQGREGGLAPLLVTNEK
jgi:hypothetical protein